MPFFEALEHGSVTNGPQALVERALLFSHAEAAYARKLANAVYSNYFVGANELRLAARGWLMDPPCN